MRQICLNLLSNAIKFTPRGGTHHADGRAHRHGGQFLSVKDNGPGIPEDEIPIVLPPSARARSPTRTPSAAPVSACRSSRPDDCMTARSS